MLPELLPVKRTKKKYEIFPANSKALPAAFHSLPLGLDFRGESWYVFSIWKKDVDRDAPLPSKHTASRGGWKPGGSRRLPDIPLESPAERHGPSKRRRFSAVIGNAYVGMAIGGIAKRGFVLLTGRSLFYFPGTLPSRVAS